MGIDIRFTEFRVEKIKDNYRTSNLTVIKTCMFINNEEYPIYFMTNPKEFYKEYSDGDYLCEELCPSFIRYLESVPEEIYNNLSANISNKELYFCRRVCKSIKTRRDLKKILKVYKDTWKKAQEFKEKLFLTSV